MNDNAPTDHTHDEDRPYTEHELQGFFQTVNMLDVCFDQIAERLCEQHQQIDSDLAQLKATKFRLLDLLFEHMPQEEFSAMEAKYFSADGEGDDLPEENHPGTERVQ